MGFISSCGWLPQSQTPNSWLVPQTPDSRHNETREVSTGHENGQVGPPSFQESVKGVAMGRHETTCPLNFRRVLLLQQHPQLPHQGIAHKSAWPASGILESASQELQINWRLDMFGQPPVEIPVAFYDAVIGKALFGISHFGGTLNLQPIAHCNIASSIFV